MRMAVPAAFSLALLLAPLGFTQTTASIPTGKTDPFVGSWKLNVAKSELDANHRAAAARMAEGVNAKVAPSTKRPNRLFQTVKSVRSRVTASH